MARDVSNIGRDIQDLVSRVAREAAVNIMNDLAEAGPVVEREAPRQLGGNTRRMATLWRPREPLSVLNQ